MSFGSQKLVHTDGTMHHLGIDAVTPRVILVPDPQEVPLYAALLEGPVQQGCYREYATWRGIWRGEPLTVMSCGFGCMPMAIAVEELARVDPETAARLHPNDHKRIVRALEVFRSTGRTISQHDRETRALPPRYDALTIGLTFRERADLWARIDRRVDQMARDGLEAEVRGLLSSGLPRTCTAMQAIGYKEFVAAVDGQISWKEAEELVKLRSRQYAKRQLTWFRRREGTQWITWEKEPDFGTARRRSTEFIREAGLG